jgi:hypothetical protein
VDVEVIENQLNTEKSVLHFKILIFKFNRLGITHQVLPGIGNKLAFIFVNSRSQNSRSRTIHELTLGLWTIYTLDGTMRKVLIIVFCGGNRADSFFLLPKPGSFPEDIFMVDRLIWDSYLAIPEALELDERGG